MLVAGVGLVKAASSNKPDEPEKPVPPPAPVGPGSRVLLVGDSLAQGLALPMKQLATEAGAVFASDGRLGTLIGQWASNSWLGADLAASKPTHVLVSLGTNDMLLTDPSTETAALSKLVAVLRASGASLLWILPPSMPFPDRGVRALIASSGLPLFRSDLLSIPRGPDGIHPTASGYAGWSAQIFKTIQPPQALGRMPVRRRRKAVVSPYRPVRRLS